MRHPSPVPVRPRRPSVPCVLLADDPEHPDSTDHYALVVAGRFGVDFTVARDEKVVAGHGRNVFHVVLAAHG